MKYIQCEQPHKIFIGEKAPPRKKEGEALLHVRKVGICGTDLHAFHGNQPFFSYPRILGHELACEVLEIEENERGIKKGDYVILIPYINCQNCAACLAGQHNCCSNLQVFGVHIDGGMQEIISYPTRLLLPAGKLTLEQIALMEPLSIGAHAVRRAGIQEGTLVTVIGCGPIGIGIIQLCEAKGANVIAVDINENRLEMVRDHFEADHVLHALDSAPDEVRKITQGFLTDVVIDATGSKKSMESATDYMRHGGKYVMVGLHNGVLNFMHPKIHAKEASILCSRNATLEDFEFVQEIQEAHKFNEDAYVTKHVSYEDMQDGFELWSRKDSKEIKVIMEWDGV